jgi:hypothetical protein
MPMGKRLTPEKAKAMYGNGIVIVFGARRPSAKGQKREAQQHEGEAANVEEVHASAPETNAAAENSTSVRPTDNSKP